ncbi:hypothetical protein ACLOJK_022963, partial [Asimina triloba]
MLRLLSTRAKTCRRAEVKTIHSKLHDISRVEGRFTRLMPCLVSEAHGCGGGDGDQHDRSHVKCATNRESHSQAVWIEKAIRPMPCQVRKLQRVTWPGCEDWKGVVSCRRYNDRRGHGGEPQAPRRHPPRHRIPQPTGGPILLHKFYRNFGSTSL